MRARAPTIADPCAAVIGYRVQARVVRRGRRGG